MSRGGAKRVEVHGYRIAYYQGLRGPMVELRKHVFGRSFKRENAQISAAVLNVGPEPTVGCVQLKVFDRSVYLLILGQFKFRSGCRISHLGTG